MFDRYTIKADARERLRSAVPKPYYEGLLYLLVAGILTALSTAMLLRNVTASSIDTYMKYIAAGQIEDGMRYLDPTLDDVNSCYDWYLKTAEEFAADHRPYGTSEE